MNIFTIIDRFVGKTVFIPLTILVCRLLKVTQYHLANGLEFLGWASLLWTIIMGYDHNDSLITNTFMLLLIAVTFVFMVIKMYRVVFTPEHHMGESSWLSVFVRQFGLIFFVLGDILSISTGMRILLGSPNFDIGTLTWPLWIWAEFARSIKTLPPPPVKEPKGEYVRVRS